MLAELIAKKKAALNARLSYVDIVQLVLLWNDWDGYDAARTCRLLVDYLGPPKPQPLVGIAMPTLLRSWKTLCLAQALGITQEQLYSVLLEVDRRMLAGF